MRSFGRLTFRTLPPVASKSCLRTSSEMLSGNPATNSFASSFPIAKPTILRSVDALLRGRLHHI